VTAGSTDSTRGRRIMTVVGTRPEIIRLSCVIPLLDRHFHHVLVHTGQNHADSLSRVFFDELRLREPDEYMGVDTSSFGRQLATLFEGFETLLDRHVPERVLILGDTNSALVALSCKRRGIPVYHMEAGNRCYDDRVPEEVNRRVIDHCSAVLIPYTARSAANLVREGIERERIFVLGNPIFEVLDTYAEAIDGSPALDRHGVEAGRYLLATMHRAENVDDAATFASLCRSIGTVADHYDLPLILSVHPRIRSRINADSFGASDVRPVDAMPFFEFVKLQKNAALVLTDSGTVQEECTIFGVPVLTIRNTTERPETVEAGSNIITSLDPDAILAAAKFLRDGPARGTWNPPVEYVEPNVASKVVRLLLSNPDWATGGRTLRQGSQQPLGGKN
jgi:UDP-N-acetylglucosamine 2-epimerase (non-hydrolysing)